MTPFLSLSDDNDVLVLVRRDDICAVFLHGSLTTVVLRNGGLVRVKDAPLRIRLLLEGAPLISAATDRGCSA